MKKLKDNGSDHVWMPWRWHGHHPIHPGPYLPKRSKSSCTISKGSVANELSVASKWFCGLDRHLQDPHREVRELVAFDHAWASNGFPCNIASEAYSYLGVKQWCQFLRLLGDSGWSESQSLKRRKKFANCCVIHRKLFAPKLPKIKTDHTP